jgi:hypothetical protein
VRWQFTVTGLSLCNSTTQLDDGLLNVTIWSGFGLLDFIRKRRTLYDGSPVQLEVLAAALRLKV